MTDAQNKQIIVLYEQWAKTMVYLTARRLQSIELAKDIVQEVFLIACCKADEMFARGDNPKAWIFRTLDNITMKEQKKSYFYREIALEDAEEPSSEYTSDYMSITELFPFGLSTDERTILLWRLVYRLTYEEIASRCNTTPEACRKRYSRAVKRCRALLEKN